jgi:hypothetical protein
MTEKMNTPFAVDDLMKEIEELRDMSDKELEVYKLEDNFFNRRIQYNLLQNFIIRIREIEAKLQTTQKLADDVRKVIEEWYQKQSISYRGKRDCVCEIDKDNIKELLTNLGLDNSQHNMGATTDEEVVGDENSPVPFDKTSVSKGDICGDCGKTKDEHFSICNGKVLLCFMNRDKEFVPSEKGEK